MEDDIFFNVFTYLLIPSLILVLLLLIPCTIIAWLDVCSTLRRFLHRKKYFSSKPIAVQEKEEAKPEENTVRRMF